jgi:hypothetical protein
MKTFEWIIFKNPLEARGLHGAPNESSFQVKIMLTSKAYGKCWNLLSNARRPTRVNCGDNRVTS